MNNYDYKAEFASAVTDIIAQQIADRTERMKAIEALTDAYVDSVGERPEPAQIERLTDYILREELTDRNEYKVTHAEYPFLSATQFEERYQREAPIKVAEECGIDGRDYRVPTRRKHTRREQRFLDRELRRKNADRSARYKRDTSPGPVDPYSLRETGGVLTDEFVQCSGLSVTWRGFIDQNEYVGNRNSEVNA